MTDFGMVRSRVPISELFIKEPTKDIPFYYKQLWDCFSENTSITKYSFLSSKDNPLITVNWSISSNLIK
jgi:hypothetical protein